MLTASGHVKLIDFGTAKDVLEPDLNGPEFVGTPEFMSPEAVDSQKDTGRAADLWAIGVVAYQFFCGTSPSVRPRGIDPSRRRRSFRRRDAALRRHLEHRRRDAAATPPRRLAATASRGPKKETVVVASP